MRFRGFPSGFRGVKDSLKKILKFLGAAVGFRGVTGSYAKGHFVGI